MIESLIHVHLNFYMNVDIKNGGHTLATVLFWESGIPTQGGLSS